MTHITIVTLGGTIAMQSQSGGARPALDGKDLVASLDIDASALQITVEALMNVPSGHLTMADIYDVSARITKALEGGSDAVVVIQGTDTIEEVAFALDLLHNGPAPIIVTGAMRVASAISADGPGNIRSAIRVAADPVSRGRGTMVVFNDTIHAARFVVKAHSSRVDSFMSRDSGPLGLVTDHHIDWYGGSGDRAFLARPPTAGSRIVLLKSYLGDDGVLARSLMKADIQGVVIEGLGGGHLPPTAADQIQLLAERLPVILTTRCQGGPTLTDTYGYIGGEIDLIRRGLIPSRSLPGEKARVALTILLDGGATLDDIRNFFSA